VVADAVAGAVLAGRDLAVHDRRRRGHAWPASPRGRLRADAARALRPLAGAAAADLFAAGLVTSALVALPVVMASTAYVASEHFNWRRGLSARAGRARRFYAILVASIGLALVVSVAGIPVTGMLVAASVTGGSGTPIGLVLLVRLARDPHIMGPQRITRRLAIAGWAVTVIVSSLGLLAILGAAVGTS
jgi:Mn2+/Fe2+ NRAMP family transporter